MTKNLIVFLLLVLLSPCLVFLFGLYDLFVQVFSSEGLISIQNLFNQELLFSVIISLLVTILSSYLGAFISFKFLSKKKTSFITKVFNIVIFLPHIAFAYLVYLMFSSTGLVARAFYPLLDEAQIFLVNDYYGVGIVLHYVFKELVFVALFFSASHRLEDKNFMRNALSLGASKAQAFHRVYLPIKKRSLFVISIILFSYTLGGYEAPYLLGANYPKFLSVRLFENFQSIDESLNILSSYQALILFFCAVVFSIITFMVMERKK